MSTAIDEILNRKDAPEGMSPHEAEMQRKRDLLKAVRVLREGQLAGNNLIRNANPEYVYIWVFNDPQRIQTYLGMPAELIKGTNDKVETDFKKTDGTHVRGDTILMRMRREISEAYKAEAEIRAGEQVEGYKDVLPDWGRQERVPVSRQ